MKIKSLTICNFRGYKNETTILFDNLTAFVGRNDAGKSTILEALDIFFNEGKGVIKLDKSDANIYSEDKVYTISVCFCCLPDTIIVDSTYETTLKDEYLLRDEDTLEIVKTFNGTKNIGTYINANYPTNPKCSELHSKKRNELKTEIEQLGIPCDNTSINAVMRKAIWDYYISDLNQEIIRVDVNSGDDTKKIWSKLSLILPRYSLFQADRQNSDGDKEVQDPLKAAVALFFQDEEIQNTLNEVATQVELKLREVSDRTLSKLREMDESVADSLKPVIPSSNSLKWADVFKNVSITGDDDIPINKRGSGVKRLILLNFFRAEVERRNEKGNSTGIIYAIEEPETSQHFANQKIIADAIKELSETNNSQVIITTHSGVIVKRLDYSTLRLVSGSNNGEKKVTYAPSGLLGYPSINEINYTAFGEVTEEYHDELWGAIESQNWMGEYESDKEQIPYVKVLKNGNVRNETHTLSRYIRDVMHHPENRNNRKYTDSELDESICLMRDFIKMKTFD